MMARKTGSRALWSLFAVLWKFTSVLVYSRVAFAHFLARQGFTPRIPAILPEHRLGDVTAERTTPEKFTLASHLADRERMFPVSFLSDFKPTPYTLLADVFAQVADASQSFTDDPEREQGSEPTLEMLSPPVAPSLDSSQTVDYTEPPDNVFEFFVPGDAMDAYIAQIQFDPSLCPFRGGFGESLLSVSCSPVY